MAPYKRRRKQAVNPSPIVQSDEPFPLPEELADVIFGYLWQHPKSLSSCALTCRPWHSAVRPHIYRSITLKSPEGLVALAEAISSEPAIAYWVREVRLQGFDTDSNYPVSPPNANGGAPQYPVHWHYRFPSAFTPSLPNLHSLEFYRWTHVLVERRQKEEFLWWFPQLANLRKVKALTFMDCQFDQQSCMAVACAFPGLLDVRFHCTDICGLQGMSVPLQQIIQHIFQLMPQQQNNAPNAPHPLVQNANAAPNPNPHPNADQNQNANAPPNPPPNPPQPAHVVLPGVNFFMNPIPIPIGPGPWNPPTHLTGTTQGITFPCLFPHPQLRSLKVHKSERFWATFSFRSLAGWVDPVSVRRSLKRLDAHGHLKSIAEFVEGLGRESVLERLELGVDYPSQIFHASGLDISHLSNLTSLHLRARTMDTDQLRTIQHLLTQIPPRNNLRQIALHLSFTYIRQFKAPDHARIDAVLSEQKFVGLREFLVVYVGALPPSKVGRKAGSVYGRMKERGVLRVVKYPDVWYQEPEV